LTGVGVVDIDLSDGLREIMLSWIFLPLYDGPVREELDGLEENMPLAEPPTTGLSVDVNAMITFLHSILAFPSFVYLSPHPRLYDPGS
jgi:hypothetical protein